jgi:hypothetical protein
VTERVLVMRLRPRRGVDWAALRLLRRHGLRVIEVREEDDA